MRTLATYVCIVGTLFLGFSARAQMVGTSSHGSIGGVYTPPAPEHMLETKAAEQKAYNEEKLQQQLQGQMMATAIARHPWRILDGKTNYIGNSDVVEFCGKILEVQPSGIRVSGGWGDHAYYFSTYPYSERNTEFFVAHFPYDVAEDEVITKDEHFFAWYVGTYTYVTVNGGSRTIRKLDYGTPCDPPPLSPEQLKALQDAQKARADAIAKTKAETAQKTLKWNMAQAEKGDSLGLQRMGERYRDGDGVERDLTKARQYFIRAREAGSKDADRALENLAQLGKSADSQTNSTASVQQ